jgi:hypothetical protein
MSPNIAVESLTFQLRNQDVPGLYISPNTGYLDWVFDELLSHHHHHQLLYIHCKDLGRVTPEVSIYFDTW